MTASFDVLAARQFLDRAMVQVQNRQLPHQVQDLLLNGKSPEAFLGYCRRYLGVIDAMTPDERQFPELLDLQPSRRERIARGTGLQASQVRDIVDDLILVQAMFRFEDSSSTQASPYAVLCEEFHAKTLAGRCPWCGCTLPPAAVSFST